MSFRVSPGNSNNSISFHITYLSKMSYNINTLHIVCCSYCTATVPGAVLSTYEVEKYAKTNCLGKIILICNLFLGPDSDHRDFIL